MSNAKFKKTMEGILHHAMGVGCFENDDEEDRCPYYDENDCANNLMKDAQDLIKEYDSAMRTMIYQYCTVKRRFLFGEDCYNPDAEVFFNSYMCAGEEAFRVMGIENGEEVPEDWLMWE